MATHNEVVIVIDEVRSFSISDTDAGNFVITLEDPHSVAIVELDKDELNDIRNELNRRLS